MKWRIRKPSVLWVSGAVRLEDITHLNISQRHPYVIAKAIRLDRLGYENFISDFTVERDFLEQHAKLCKTDKKGVWHCLLVLERGHSDGVLVMPDEEGFVKYAAYLAKGADQFVDWLHT